MAEAGQPGGGSLAEALGNGARLLEREPEAAAEQARAILEVDALVPAAHRLLAAALRRTGDEATAQIAEQDALEAAARDPILFEARISLAGGQLNAAEQLLRPYLTEHPHEPVALRMLAEIAARTGHRDQAAQLLRNALHIAPRYAAAKAELEALSAPQYETTGTTGYEEALALYRDRLAREPGEPATWMNFGHMLRIAGALEESIAAYRRALALNTALGEAWWSLADLKTISLGDDDIAAMTAALEATDLDDQNRVGLHYALGKAFEDGGRHEASFRHYDEGARLRRALVTHDPGAVEHHVAAAEALFTPEFFADRKGWGAPDADPIFILGMPRAGSTLIEQILASHSQIEGTTELPDLPNLAKLLADGRDAGLEDSPYFAAMSAIKVEQAGQYGAAYLWGTRLRRRSQRPYFIDKMPNNWLHVGLIQLILPNAKIIDVRRHPLGCCLSNFKQNFVRGQAFSFALDELGRFYSSYVRMMAHIDAVLPGRVHRVCYEELVDNPETEIRRLLAHLALPFEESCLKFHENSRAVRTSSSEQVRRPINREGIDQWRHFEPWLGPLKSALGPVLDCYPETPPDWR